jgi:predicted metal-binding membrane protein
VPRSAERSAVIENTTPTEALLRRDRLIVLAGLAIIAILSWLYLLDGAGTGMSVRAMTTWRFPPPLMPADDVGWNVGYALVMLAMWWVMMIAMMVPSATPMILLYARVTRHAQAKGQIEAAAIPTARFAFGYLVAWLLFSIAAVALQWALERAGLLQAMTMWSLNKWLSAALLFAAGLYQLSPLKDVCLRHCRSPAEFLSRHWRRGQRGAFRMGLDHGLYCVGCCWFLMALLFAGGIMNLVWIAGLAIFVLVEKVALYGHWIARAAGVLFIGGGVWVLAAT